MSQENNPYDAPESEVQIPDLGLRDEASRWLRLFAAAIDGLIAIIITLPLMLYYGVFETAMAGKELGYSYTVMFTLLGIVAFMLLHGYLLKTKGQTIGKMVLGTKIVDLDGNLPHFGKLISLRYLPLWVLQLVPAINILALVDVLFIFRGDRRCVHDLIAGTKVIRIIK
jgi:uncharacterized RDD family membrane protein YckC